MRFKLTATIGGALDLIRTILPLTKADQKHLAAARKSWEKELELRAVRPQELRPFVWGRSPLTCPIFIAFQLAPTL